MRSMTLPKETAQVQEQRLWSEYMLAEVNENRVSCQYQKAWREHVVSDVDDETTAEKWSELSARWHEACERAWATRKAWQRVAYPLYGWPLPEEDGSSS